MSSEALTRLKSALSSANTMDDFLRICAEHYDFKGAKLQPLSKVTLISNIGTVIQLSGAKPKHK